MATRCDDPALAAPIAVLFWLYVTALAVPQNDPRSSQISSQAVPMLVDQAISAQSSSISGVSGATATGCRRSS